MANHCSITQNQPAAAALRQDGGSTLLTGNSDHHPSHPKQKTEEPQINSCFILVGAHHCGILMDVLR